MLRKKEKLPHDEYPTHGLVNGVDPVINFMKAMSWPDKRGGFSRTADMAVSLAYRMADYLHHCIGTDSCRNGLGPGVCAMCREAARLAVQELVPKIEKRVVKDIQRQFNVECDFPHPGDD